jgi:hypothetical protein
MGGADKWIWCGLIGVMALAGLFVAANGGPENPVAYYGGLGFFVFCLLFIFYQMKLAFDARDRGNKHSH